MENPIVGRTDVGGRTGFSMFALAAVYSAVVVAITSFFDYGAQTVGAFAALVALVVGFFLALALAPVFFWARAYISEIAYFSLHLFVGLGIGAYRAAKNPYALGWQDLILVPESLIVVAASLSAWVFVVVTVSPGRPLRRRPDSWKSSGRAALLLAFLVLPAPVMVSKSATDLSCHNTFRGGRTAARPELRLRFQLSESDQAKISTLYGEFAQSHELSVRGHPYVPESQQRSLCNDDVVFSAGGVFKEGRYGLSAYPHEDAGDWRPLAGRLVCFLEQNLESEIQYTGDDGERIDRPAFLLESCR